MAAVIVGFLLQPLEPVGPPVDMLDSVDGGVRLNDLPPHVFGGFPCVQQPHRLDHGGGVGVPTAADPLRSSASD